MINNNHLNTPPSQELSDNEMLRYTRQILLAGWDIEAQMRLKNSTAVIIGMGGLGCPLAETLCRAGIGQLVIFDDDTIDESNIQRQSLFLPADIGLSKALVAKQKLNNINEFCEVIAIEQRLSEQHVTDFIQLIKTNSLSKLICDCTDNFKTRDIINSIAVKQKLPLLSASAIAQTGQLALFEPNQGCYHCVFQGAGEDDRTCATSGVLASTTQIIGNLQAQAALSYLGLGKNPIAQTLLLWQGESMSLRKLSYQKDAHCDICSPL